MMKMTLVLIGFVLLAARPGLAFSKCEGLQEELKAMKQAQSAIMQSLVNNHESFASSMEEFAANVEKAPKVVSKEMSKSAQAFRVRGVQGKHIAEKLNRATNDLLERVASCL